MAKNPCAKTQTPETAWEVWQSEDGFTYYVLKKYQSPEHEERNEFSRWYLLTTSPMVPKGEYGDGYAKEIKEKAHKLSFNPLVPLGEQEVNRTLIVQAVTDEIREHFTVIDLTPRARKNKEYQIELPAGCIHTISKERSIIGPFDFYDCQDGRVIVTDHAWNQLNASMKKREVS